jgi:hypothetical protein
MDCICTGLGTGQFDVNACAAPPGFVCEWNTCGTVLEWIVSNFELQTPWSSDATQATCAERKVILDNAASYPQDGLQDALLSSACCSGSGPTPPPTPYVVPAGCADASPASVATIFSGNEGTLSATTNCAQFASFDGSNEHPFNGGCQFSGPVGAAIRAVCPVTCSSCPAAGAANMCATTSDFIGDATVSLPEGRRLLARRRLEVRLAEQVPCSVVNAMALSYATVSDWAAVSTSVCAASASDDDMTLSSIIGPMSSACCGTPTASSDHLSRCEAPVLVLGPAGPSTNTEWVLVKATRDEGRCEFEIPRSVAVRSVAGFTTPHDSSTVADCKAACDTLVGCNSISWDPQLRRHVSACNLHTPPGSEQPHDTKGSSPEQCWFKATPTSSLNPPAKVTGSFSLGGFTTHPNWTVRDGPPEASTAVLTDLSNAIRASLSAVSVTIDSYNSLVPTAGGGRRLQPSAVHVAVQRRLIAYTVEVAFTATFATKADSDAALQTVKTADSRATVASSIQMHLRSSSSFPSGATVIAFKAEEDKGSKSRCDQLSGEARELCQKAANNKVGVAASPPSGTGESLTQPCPSSYASPHPQQRTTRPRSPAASSAASSSWRSWPSAGTSSSTSPPRPRAPRQLPAYSSSSPSQPRARSEHTFSDAPAPSTVVSAVDPPPTRGPTTLTRRRLRLVSRSDRLSRVIYRSRHRASS